MNLEILPRRIVEAVDRRALGALQFVDAVTRLPVVGPAHIEVRGATRAGVPLDVALGANAIRILQNRRGVAVILQAPSFETYTSTFLNPAAQPDPIELRIAVLDAGRSYLPQEFTITLPRSLDPDASGSVFEPVPIGLFRSPDAPVQEGWAVLRVRVVRAGSDPPATLPGVLVRVFASPRGASAPIGAGLTDWRGTIRGEALVPVVGIQRFRPGSGDNVIETDLPIEIEVTRDGAFTGAAGQLPNVPAILAASGAGMIRPPDLPPGSHLDVLHPETTPIRLQAGREYVVELAMA